MGIHSAIQIPVAAELLVFTFVCGLAFRLLAIRFKLEMPKFVYERDEG